LEIADTAALSNRLGLATLLILISPIGGRSCASPPRWAVILILALAGIAWSGAFGLFVLLYAGPLARPRASAGAARASRV
jgi:hypothetical protein